MEINWTPQAIDSLIETIHFIHDHLGNNVARKIRLMIEKKVGLLAENPLLGKVAEEYAFNQTEFRFLIINKKCKVFYFINDGCVHIVLVWDNRQDIMGLKKLLNEKD